MIYNICIKVEFQIQILYSCYSSNTDNTYTVNVGKISPYIYIYRKQETEIRKNCLIDLGPKGSPSIFIIRVGSR